MNKLKLDVIATRLEGLEETIIARLIDRAQFKKNDVIYEPGRSGFKDEAEKSLFELRLFHQECIDSEFGRFEVFEERPFNKGLPEVKRRVVLPDTGLCLDDPERINLTGKIKKTYLELVGHLCPGGDDFQYGSSVEHDVYALQAISRRIHFGAFYVAESKFSDEPDTYTGLLRAGDIDAVMAKLTRREVEERIIQRVSGKVEAIQAKANPAVRVLIDPEVIVSYYRNTVIPLTKDGEIAYLKRRVHF
jgi:chorismate mutase